jgi:hypothetical protein
MQGKRMSFCGATGWRAALLCACWLIVPVAPARADAPLTLSVNQSNPSGTTPLTITAALGQTTATGSTLEVIVNPAGQLCPGDPASDPNRQVTMPPVTGGPQTLTSSPFTLEHGAYTVCGWLEDPTNGPSTAQAALTVANPDTLSFNPLPSTIPDGVATPLSLTGVADVQDPRVYVTRKPAANGRCAADPGADGGAPLTGFDPAVENFGSFTSSSLVALGGGPAGLDSEPPGQYLLCAWLMDAAGSKTVPLASPASAMVTLTAPTGTLAYSLGGQLVTARSRFSITMSFTTQATDVALYLDLKPLPARGRPCAATHAADRGALKTFTDTIAGHGTTAFARLATPGVYVACAWLEWPHGTVDGPFPGRFVVAGGHQRATLYYGLTSQKIPRSKLKSTYPIVFQVIDGQVVNLSYFARYTCTLAGKPTSHPIYTTAFPAFGLSTPLSFGDTFVSGSDHALVSGQLGGRLATGTLSESYRSGRYTCRSGTVAFTARRG